MAKKGISLPKIGDKTPDPIDLPVKCFYCQANSWEVYQRISPKTAIWLRMFCRACGREKNL